jgi:hypothetical protein
MGIFGKSILGKSVIRFFLALLTATLATQAVAQGIHITLRGTSNPVPGRYRYSDVVAEGNYAYLASWSTSSGVLIVDISTPEAPKKVATYAPANSKNMQGIAVLNGIGYFASDSGGGVHIVNLSDPVHPVQITRITSASCIATSGRATCSSPIRGC